MNQVSNVSVALKYDPSQNLTGQSTQGFLVHTKLVKICHAEIIEVYTWFAQYVSKDNF
jgi:hypothetical protein